jgi:hypothetical protein
LQSFARQQLRRIVDGFISISFLLIVLGAGVLLSRHFRHQIVAGMVTPIAVLLVLLAFAVSLLDRGASSGCSGSWVKYGKLIMVLLLVILIRDRREALYALSTFCRCASLLLASSWMLFSTCLCPGQLPQWH